MLATLALVARLAAFQPAATAQPTETLPLPGQVPAPQQPASQPPAGPVADPAAVSSPPASAPAAAPIPASPMPGAPRPSDVQSRANLEQRTGLDLEGVWERYVRQAQAQQTFADFTVRHYRRRMGLGIGLTLGGAALTGLGLGLVLANEARKDVSPGAALADGLGAFFLTAAGTSLIIPGAIIWAIGASRLGKVRRAGLALAPGGLRLAF